MLRPGGISWLVAHDARLAWRELTERFSRSKTVISRRRMLSNLIALYAFMHLFGWVVVLVVRNWQLRQPELWLALDIVVALALLTFIGIALTATVNLVFVRNDFDFLCSSPVPVGRLFAARSIGVALQTLALPALLVFPVVDMAMVYGDFSWLAVYPMTIALALLATAIGMSLTVVLVRVIGARATRNLALALAAVLAAVVFLALETPAMLGDQRWQSLTGGLTGWLSAPVVAADGSWLWYPARANAGAAGPLLLCLTISALAFAAVMHALPRGFAYALQGAAGLGGARARHSAGASRMDPNFWRVWFLKEWRLIYRDPRLLAQLFRQLIFLLPMAIILLRGFDGSQGGIRNGILVCLLTFVFGQLADLFTWLTVCAEDAPEMLAVTPHTGSKVRRAKLFAALLPLWVAATPIAASIAVGGIANALCFVIAVAGISLSMGVFHLWLPIPGSRTDMRRRMRRAGGMDIHRILVSVAILIGWSGVAGLLPAGHWIFGMVALVIAISGPAYAWYAGRRSNLSLAY